jgi:hypothetical protein
MRIKRLYEADDVQELPMNGQMQAPEMPQMPPAMPQMAPPAQVESPAEMMPDFDFQENPDQEQQALPQPDVMNLTVRELIDRCNAINPLICMGLQQFIDSNNAELLNQTTGDITADGNAPEETGDITADDTDVNFSKQMEPQAPEFSLDQPAQELDFPQA